MVLNRIFAGQGKLEGGRDSGRDTRRVQCSVLNSEVNWVHAFFWRERFRERMVNRESDSERQ